MDFENNRSSKKKWFPDGVRQHNAIILHTFKNAVFITNHETFSHVAVLEADFLRWQNIYKRILKTVKHFTSLRFRTKGKKAAVLINSQKLRFQSQ